MPNRIRIGDWETTIDELRRFGKTGNMTTGDERIRIDFGSAHVEVSKHGHVSTGMPLHDFEHDGVADLVVDHDAGSLTVEANDATYTFRRPDG